MSQEWNANPHNTYKLAMNHLGDVSAEEHRSMLAGNRERRAAWAAAPGLPVVDHVPTVPLHLLPPTVDWRGSPADSPVKNQGGCGSCWVRLDKLAQHAIPSKTFKAVGGDECCSAWL